MGDLLLALWILAGCHKFGCQILHAGSFGCSHRRPGRDCELQASRHGVEGKFRSSSLHRQDLEKERVTRVCVVDRHIGTDDGVAACLASLLSLDLLPSVDAVDPDLYTHALTLIPYDCYNIHDYAVGISAVNPVRRSGSRRKPKASPKQKLSAKPAIIDFCPPETSRLGRRSTGESGPDLLIKAVAPQRGFRPDGAVVYDLTAGFGQDALLILNSGAKLVHMVERDPIVSSLLSDALRRLHLLGDCCNDEALRNRAHHLSKRLFLTNDDGVAVARQLMNLESDLRPDIMYIDTMFPSRKKTASVKKNMQILHTLLASQNLSFEDERLSEEEALLSAAHAAAKVRVVVKRPINAPLLGIPERSELRPAYAVRGKINRWDVYTSSSSGAPIENETT